MPEPNNDDQLIDAALRTYGPEPDGFLEARVLARIEQSRRRRRRAWAVWSSGVALAASILLAIVLTNGRPHSEYTSAPAVLPAANVAAAPAMPTEPAAKPARPRVPVRTNAALTHLHPRPNELRPPRLPVFPSPAPLTTEEAALVSLVAHTTPDALKEIADAQQKTTEPLHIASISIAPIEPPAEGKE